MLLVAQVGCKPLAREESSSHVQASEVLRVIKRHILDSRFHKARQEIERIFEKNLLYSGRDRIKIADADRAEQFLRSYVEPDITDIDNIVAKIGGSDMPEVLRLLRSMPKEIADIHFAQMKRARDEALAISIKDSDHQRIRTQLSKDFVDWRAKTEQRLTRAVKELLTTRKFTGTTYPRRQDFDKAQSRIENMLQKVQESFAALGGY